MNIKLLFDKICLQTKEKKQYIQPFILSVCIILLSFYISTNWYQLILIHGESMSPSYHNMQLVIINKYFKNYTYGDVIAFQCEGLNTILIKRIVACPGDKVQIQEDQLYVNDEISNVYPLDTFAYAGIAENTMHLEDGQYFVIGDNIAQSKDSRYSEVGCVSKATILGVVLFS